MYGRTTRLTSLGLRSAGSIALKVSLTLGTRAFLLRGKHYLWEHISPLGYDAAAQQRRNSLHVLRPAS